ncbi:MAG: hypothetical protein L0Y54_11420, partial [Sporichthyaceae bacterium]|nr:hypothetical protein [Sporichthyaceae bacterium]
MTNTASNGQPGSGSSLPALEHAAPFAHRHIGLTAGDQDKMLAFLGYTSLDDLTSTAVPAAIATKDRLDLPPAASEAEVLAELRGLASRNRPMVQMIGLGYSDTITPPVIQRNVLENPG